MTNSENKIKHEIQDDGTEIWKDSNEIFHQHDDLPAIIYPNGTEEYYKNGKRFREFGPKIKLPNGHEVWNTNENYFWHREDGAAVIRPNGERKYWINDRIMTYEQFKKQNKT